MPVVIDNSKLPKRALKSRKVAERETASWHLARLRFGTPTYREHLSFLRLATPEDLIEIGMPYNGQGLGMLLDRLRDENAARYDN